MNSTHHLRNLMIYLNHHKMFVVCLSILLSAYFHTPLKAQQFCSFAGINIANEDAKSLVKTFDGGYAIAGKSDSAFTKRAFVYKFDAQGNLTWTQIIHNNYSCEAYSLVQCKDSSLLMLGYIPSAPGVNGIEILAVKLKLDGTVLFHKMIGKGSGNSDEVAFAASTCVDGGVLMVCQTNKNTSSVVDLLLVKISAAGSILWARDLIDASYVEIPVSIKSDVHNNFLISGYAIPAITSNPQFYDIFLLKVDSIGNVKWAKTLGGNKFDQANSLTVLNNDAGYAICGRTESYGSVSASSAAYMVLLDTAGSIKWSRTFNMPSFQLVEFNDVVADSNNDLITCGLIQSFTPSNDVSLLVKYNYTSGNVMWTKVYEDYVDSYSAFRSIITDGNNFAVCGKTNRFNFSDNLQLTKFDQFGNSCCTSDSLLAYVIDSGFTSGNWLLHDTLTNEIADNGPIGTIESIGPGMYDYCISTAISELLPAKTFTLFPNPGDGIFELKFESIAPQSARINVFNASGEKVFSWNYDKIEQQVTIDISKQAQGIYLLQVLMNENEIRSQKLMKL